MKIKLLKIIVLSLIIALVFPICIVTGADEKETTVNANGVIGISPEREVALKEKRTFFDSVSQAQQNNVSSVTGAYYRGNDVYTDLQDIEVGELTKEEEAVLEKIAKEAEEKAKIRKEYVNETVSIINSALNSDYPVVTVFDYDLMVAAVDAYDSQMLNEDEREKLKGYIAEYSCGVLGEDPLYQDILRICYNK